MENLVKFWNFEASKQGPIHVMHAVNIWSERGKKTRGLGRRAQTNQQQEKKKTSGGCQL